MYRGRAQAKTEYKFRLNFKINITFLHRKTNTTNSENNSYKNIPDFLTFNTDI